MFRRLYIFTQQARRAPAHGSSTLGPRVLNIYAHRETRARGVRNILTFLKNNTKKLTFLGKSGAWRRRRRRQGGIYRKKYICIFQNSSQFRCLCGVYWDGTSAYVRPQVSARVCVRARNRKITKNAQNTTQYVASTPDPHYGPDPSIRSVQGRPRALRLWTVGRGHRILSTIIWARLVAWVHELLLTLSGPPKSTRIRPKSPESALTGQPGENKNEIEKSQQNKN